MIKASEVGEKMYESIFPQRIVQDRHEERAQKIMSLLRKDCRASLTEVASRTGMKLSTTHRVLELMKKHNVLSLEVIPTKGKIYGNLQRETRLNKIMDCLKEDPRMSLTDMSRRTGIPVSTIFDNINTLRQGYQLRLKLVRKA